MNMGGGLILKSIIDNLENNNWSINKGNYYSSNDNAFEFSTHLDFRTSSLVDKDKDVKFEEVKYILSSNSFNIEYKNVKMISVKMDDLDYGKILLTLYNKLIEIEKSNLLELIRKNDPIIKRKMNLDLIQKSLD